MISAFQSCNAKILQFSPGNGCYQWIMQLVCGILIRCIVIYPVDIALSKNNWGLGSEHKYSVLES